MHRALAHYIQEQNVLFWQLDFQNKVIVVWVYVGPRATHFTGYCCLVYAGLGQHTLLGIVVGLCGALDNTLYWV
jgi:hypothetical protein